MAEPTPRTYIDSLAILARKGVRYGTAIDAGCADGHFFPFTYVQGLLDGAVPFNIDPNSIYEPSLKAVKEVCGGDYLIAAVSNEPGQLMLTKGAHPYWSSLRPVGDRYWKQINDLNDGVEAVPAVRLDVVVNQFGLKPPYLLKLDVQGGEMNALRGAARMLVDTKVIVVEAGIEDFSQIHSFVSEAGFRLFDIGDLTWVNEGMLAWFYPVYVSRDVQHVTSSPTWSAEHNASVVRMQHGRRKYILDQYSGVLEKIRGMKNSAR
jgi:FkbM family methyltransferase